MQIELKIISFLSRDFKNKEGWIEIEPGKTVSQLLKEFEIPLKKLGIITVNGRRVDTSTHLKQGDTLALFPRIEGG